MNPEIEELEDILDTILAGVQELLASGETIPPEFQEQIANEINFLTQEIDGLYAQSQQAQEGVSENDIREEIPLPNNESIPPGAQLLWILSGGNIDAFVNYMHQIPDPDLNQLVRNPDELDRVIYQLHSQFPKGQPSVEGGIPHADLNSSNIWGARRLKNGNVQVRFQGGSVYEYNNVPPQIFKAFMMGAIPANTKGHNRYGAWWKGKQPSLGASFHELIKSGAYPYKRLS